MFTLLIGRPHLSTISDDERQALKYVKCGQVDEAIHIYQRLTPDSPRILSIIGVLYCDKKGDYDSAIHYFKRALDIQEKNGEDTSITLSELGIIYQSRCDYDVALTYHCRALGIRKMAICVDRTLVASNLIGIANADWGQQNLSEALKYAQQALTLNESIKPDNDLGIGTNLAILANIYHSIGDDVRALKIATEAMTIMENCVSRDSPVLATLLNNIGVIQLSLGLFTDAQLSYVRVMKIYKETLPAGHPKRVTMENNVQQIIAMQHGINMNAYFHLQKFLSKILLL